MAGELPVVRRLRGELDKLQHELQVLLPRELETVRSFGDLSENAEYEAAKGRQDYLRARIAQLEGRIRDLSLYNLSSVPSHAVGYGSVVTLEDTEEGETLEVKIVFPEEVDAAVGHISLSSPLGKALLNREVGEEVTVRVPRGQKTYQIVRLRTLHDQDQAED